jgi:hypothetical protein
MVRVESSLAQIHRRLAHMENVEARPTIMSRLRELFG